MTLPRRALGALLLAAGCGAPSPAAPPPPPPATTAREPAPCERAATLRTRAATLVEERRFFRAQQALSAADALCPADAPSGWVAALTIFQELRQPEAALGLLATIRAAADVPAEARQAAVALQQELDRKNAEPAHPTVSSSVLIEATLTEAEKAWGQRDWARAAQRWGEAALADRHDLAMMRGVGLLRAGQTAEGRLAVERAAAALLARAPTNFSFESSFGRTGPHAISPLDGSVMLGHHHHISIHDPVSLREREVITLPESFQPLQGLDISPNGQIMVAAGQKELYFMSSEQGNWQLLSTPVRPYGTSGVNFDRDHVVRSDDGQFFSWAPLWQVIDRNMLFRSVAEPDLLYGGSINRGWLVPDPHRSGIVMVSGRSERGRSSRLIPFKRGVTASDLAPDESVLAVASGSLYSLLDAATGRERWSRSGTHRVTALWFIDQQRLLVESDGAESYLPPDDAQPMGLMLRQRERFIVDVATGKTLLTLERGESTPFNDSKPSRYRLAVADTLVLRGPDLLSWDLATGKRRSAATHPCPPGATGAVLPGGELRCLESDPLEGEFLTDARSGERRQVMSRAHYHLAQVALSPGGEALAVLDYGGTLHHFGLRDGSWVAHPDKEDRSGQSDWGTEAHVALSARGDSVAWVMPRRSGGQRLSSARLGARATVSEFSDREIVSLAVSEDRLLACQRNGPPLLSFQLPALEPLPEVVRLPQKDATTRCALSPDGRLLACSGSFDEITVRDARTGAHVASLQGSRSVGDDGSASRSTFEGVRALTFSANGKALASANGHEIHLWDVERASLSAVIPAHVPEFILSPDGARLGVFSNHNRLLSLFAAPWGTPLATTSTASTPSRLFFSADQRLLSVASNELTSLDQRGRTSLPAWTTSFSGVTHRKVAHAPGARLLASATTHGIELRDDERGELRATLRLLRKDKGWYAFTPEGLFDWGGDPDSVRAVLSCRLERQVFPIEACEDRLRVPGLLARVARGERVSLDPAAP